MFVLPLSLEFVHFFPEVINLDHFEFVEFLSVTNPAKMNVFHRPLALYYHLDLVHRLLLLRQQRLTNRSLPYNMFVKMP